MFINSLAPHNCKSSLMFQRAFANPKNSMTPQKYKQLLTSNMV